MGFNFNSGHTSTKYIKAIIAPRAIVPERKTEIVEIPFNSEGYVIQDNSYKHEIISVKCWTEIPSNKSIYEVGREWTTWLHTNTWSNLIFDDDPTFTYKAMCITPITPEDLRNPEITIEFRVARPNPT